MHQEEQSLIFHLIGRTFELWNQANFLQNGIRTNFIDLVLGRLSRDAIIHVLDPGERIIADRGYRDQTFFDIPDGSEDDEQK